MFTLKNIFWVTLVILNLTFITVVSYTRLKPAPEVNSHNVGETPVNSGYYDSTDRRYASPTSGDSLKPKETDHSSEKSMRFISGTGQAPKNTGMVTAPATKPNTPKNTHLNQSSNRISPGTIEIAAAAKTKILNTQEGKSLSSTHLKDRRKLEEKYKVDTYYDGNLVRTEESDIDGNIQITVKEAMDTHDLGKLPDDDARYMEALNQLDIQDQEPELLRGDIGTAVSKPISEFSSNGNAIDYFNKVDVSTKSNQPQLSNNLTLAKQIENTVSGIDTSNPKRGDKTDELFFRSLETESEIRTNEMRTIQVTHGDTLWDIAERAYGNGFEYEKIFEANPQLSDPDSINVGDTLRVPI
jgi:hypothetical protein